MWKRVSALVLFTAAIQFTEAQQFKTTVEFLTPNEEVFGVAHKDGYVYAATNTSNLHVFDAREIDVNGDVQIVETPVKTIALGLGTIRGMRGHGDYLYPYGNGGLQAIDVSDPTDPSPVGDVLDENFLNTSPFEGGLLFVDNRVGFISLENPAQPALGAVLDLERRGFAVVGYRDRVYVSDFQIGQTGRLIVFDFSNRQQLVQTNVIERGTANHLLLFDDQIVECAGDGLKLLDLLDPDNPVQVAVASAPTKLCEPFGRFVVTRTRAVAVGRRSLQRVTIFNSAGIASSGFPHGSAVGPEHVFQSLSGKASAIRVPSNFTFPQYVDGGGNRSRVVMRNNGPRTLYGVARFFDGMGAAQTATVEAQAVDKVELEIAPGGVQQIETDGTGDLTSGVVEVRAGSPSPDVSGTLVFELLGNFVSVASSPRVVRTNLFVTHNAQERTGLAAYNADPDADRRIDLDIKDAAGTIMASDQIALAPLERKAIFLDELTNIGAYLAGQADFLGSLDVEVENEEAALVLALVQRLSDGALFSVAN